MYLLLLLVTLLPALFWLYVFYRLDQEKEPWALVMLAFLGGSLMAFLASLLEVPFSPFLEREGPLFLQIFFFAFLEETLKFLPVILFIYSRDEFNEVPDGILYVLAAGLGFAFTENLFYSFLYGLEVGLIRALLTTLAHASFSGILGFHLGLTLIYPEQRFLLIGEGLLKASLLHAFYNYLLLLAFISLPLLFLSILFLQIYLYYLMKKAHLFPFY